MELRQVGRRKGGAYLSAPEVVVSPSFMPPRCVIQVAIKEILSVPERPLIHDFLSGRHEVQVLMLLNLGFEEMV